MESPLEAQDKKHSTERKMSQKHEKPTQGSQDETCGLDV